MKIENMSRNNYLSYREVYKLKKEKKDGNQESLEITTSHIERFTAINRLFKNSNLKKYLINHYTIILCKKFAKVYLFLKYNFIILTINFEISHILGIL